MEPIEKRVWACSCCGRTYTKKNLTQDCCTCSRCGRAGIDTRRPGGLCEQCANEKAETRRKRTWDMADKVAPENYGGAVLYVERYDQWLENEAFDGLVAQLEQAAYPDPFPAEGQSVEEAFDSMRVFAAYDRPIEISAGRILDDLDDDAYEGYETDLEAELAIRRFAKEWNERYAKTMWLPDYSTAICATLHRDDGKEGA